VTIAAASDLAIAFEEVGRAFHAKTGVKAVFRFGSSGLLAQQVRELAPFDVYASANVSFVDQVVASGACLADTQRNYALGRIVVWSQSQRITSLADLVRDRRGTLLRRRAPRTRAARRHRAPRAPVDHPADARRTCPGKSAPPASVVLALENVSVRYGEVQAVHGATFELEARTIAALVGPSGCGKTSLLRSIAGFEVPSAGTVTLDGRVVAGPGRFVPPEEREVGLVFQQGALFPHRSRARPPRIPRLRTRLRPPPTHPQRTPPPLGSLRARKTQSQGQSAERRPLESKVRGCRNSED
jgi:ABC-type multidrug transport system fused ATPase/permease subunit